jgi:hypothetical protein
VTDLERMVFAEVYAAELVDSAGSEQDAAIAMSTALRAVRLLRSVSVPGSDAAVTLAGLPLVEELRAEVHK